MNIHLLKIQLLLPNINKNNNKNSDEEKIKISFLHPNINKYNNESSKLTNINKYND